MDVKLNEPGHFGSSSDLSVGRDQLDVNGDNVGQHDTADASQVYADYDSILVHQMKLVHLEGPNKLIFRNPGMINNELLM
jgi:hypothetical protein